MRSILPLFFAFMLLTVFSCRKDDITTTTTITPPVPSVKIETAVHGLVTDENNTPIADALVRMGDAQTTTNAQGYFSLSDFQSSIGALVNVEKAGYFNAYPVFKPNANSQEFLTIQLIERQLSGSVSAQTGGEITLPNGSAVVFEPGSFVTTNGESYSGDVQVFAHYLDPTDEDLYKYMPGNLTALNSENEMRALVTFGMLNVELETSSGEELNINQAAVISMPVPADIMANAPATIPLWYYDETLGLWIEEGQATLAGNTYSGEVNHFTFWNCDVPFPFVNVNGQIDVNGFAPYVEVRLTRLDTGESASDHTDDKGLFDGKVPMDAVFLLEVINDCGTVIYSEQVGPFSVDTNLGTYYVTQSDDWSEISGTLVDCDMNPTTGILMLQGDNGIFDILQAGSNGAFYKLVATCEIDEITVVAVDANAQVESDELSFAVAPIMNLGMVAACGNTITSGVEYNLYGGSNIFIPFCTVTVENDPDSGNPQIYTFVSTYEDSPGNYVTTEYIFLDWNADPNNPLYGMAYNETVFGTPTTYYQPGGGDISLIFADYTPGGSIQMIIENCDAKEAVSGTIFPGSTVTITGIVQ
ncbi:MAG: hypothetical protein KDC34_02140 [Saprospiraceae bacterium]|nr:hypothetical protein [Saprospiraceae bacterium]